MCGASECRPPEGNPVTQPNVEAFVQGLGIWDGTTDATGPSPRAKCSFVQRGWWPQAARATAGEGRYDQILKCSERSTQQIRYRPTGPQAPWDRIRANADNRKASRISLFVSKTVAGEPQGEDATVLLINIYRTSVSGVLRRKDSGFAVCGKNLASVSQFVAGIRQAGCCGRFAKKSTS